MNDPEVFISYARTDFDFVTDLANKLQSNGEKPWVDQLSIRPGQRWDEAVQSALERCKFLIVVLSPDSVTSTNVMDEVSFALDAKEKRVVPVIIASCNIPFRLRRLQHLDFVKDRDAGFSELLRILRSEGPSQPATGGSAPQRRGHSKRVATLFGILLTPLLGWQLIHWMDVQADNKLKARFMDHGTTVVDTTTNLVWSKADSGVKSNYSFGNDTVGLGWDLARQYCEGLHLGDADDWRLPSIEELEGLAIYEKDGVSGLQKFTSIRMSSYCAWSATKGPTDGPSSALVFNFNAYGRGERGISPLDYKGCRALCVHRR
jgi:hypothetical protein